MNSNKIASPWSCESCSSKLSHSQVSEIVQDIANKIKEWTYSQPVENWSEILTKIDQNLHPNHYLVFKLKKAIITKLKGPLKLEKLEEKLGYCEQVLEIVNKLDPGLTLQRAFLLKTTAMTRTELVKSIKSTEDQSQLKRCAELSKKAIEELRMVAMCLRPPKSPKA